MSPVPLKLRIGLWVLAWLGVGIVTAYAVLGSITGVLLLPVFPTGLAYIIDPASKGTPFAAVIFTAASIAYIVLSILLLRSRSWIRYWVLYGVLLIMLILNGVGCDRQARTIKLTQRTWSAEMQSSAAQDRDRITAALARLSRSPL